MGKCLAWMGGPLFWLGYWVPLTVCWKRRNFCKNLSFSSCFGLPLDQPELSLTFMLHRQNTAEADSVSAGCRVPGGRAPGA